MTKDERSLAKQLMPYQSVELHKYKSVNGHIYYKVKADGKALNLVKRTTVDRMDLRGNLITGNHPLRTLNVTQLKANLLDWQAKQDNKNK